MSADPTATVPDLDAGDEPYDSAEDEDFQDDAVQDDSGLSSSSDADEDIAEPAKKKRKTGPKGKKANAKGQELDSGDEATIEKAKARKEKRGKAKKSKAKGGDDTDEDDDVDFDDDEEGGPGGFVRTRAMRMHMREERKPLAQIDGATIDVNALWERMNAPETDSGPGQSQIEMKDAVSTEEDKGTGNQAPSNQGSKQQASHSEEMIKIKRTYEFAGQMMTEEKIVPKHSAEAKLFLASRGNINSATGADDAKVALKLRRPLRKISRFDPNPSGTIKKSWEKQASTEATLRGPKINTVEKSRLDWAAYVDQAGIKDELNVHSKAKEGYLGRMDFLDRVDSKREDERRNARLRGV